MVSSGPAADQPFGALRNPSGPDYLPAIHQKEGDADSHGQHNRNVELEVAGQSGVLNSVKVDSVSLEIAGPAENLFGC